jgi:hypothetical protein
VYDGLKHQQEDTMRMKPKYREVEPGVWTGWPRTREEAVAEGCVYYLPAPHTDPCSVPNHGGCSVRFTLTGFAKCCCHDHAYNEHKNAMLRGEPPDPSQAQARGMDYYWRADFGKFCGHVGKTTLDGKCYICQTIKNIPSPRQAAIAAGEKWYMPADGDLCKEGHHALRRVTDGVCKTCLEAKHTPQEDRIDKLCPDLVIDREAAIGMGFKIYRTGQPCRNGHTGWRYVSTRGCLDCLGR